MSLLKRMKDAQCTEITGFTDQQKEQIRQCMDFDRKMTTLGLTSLYGQLPVPIGETKLLPLAETVNVKYAER